MISKIMTLDENGTAVGEDRRNPRKTAALDGIDSDSDEEDDEDEESEEGGEGVGGAVIFGFGF